MNRATLIQCTNSKRDETTVARCLYDESDYFVKMRNWAEAKDEPWFILSAKHGLVEPDEHLEPYDEFGLSEGQAQRIAKRLVDECVEVVDICAGKKYTQPLIPELERFGIDVVDNFSGMGIGERKAKLVELVDELQHHTL